jgi:hypothetical protein
MSWSVVGGLQKLKIETEEDVFCGSDLSRAFIYCGTGHHAGSLASGVLRNHHVVHVIFVAQSHSRRTVLTQEALVRVGANSYVPSMYSSLYLSVFTNLDEVAVCRLDSFGRNETRCIIPLQQVITSTILYIA